ncbi:pleckstrin (PH) domain-containing protein [Tieghemostelium lacteum]|uniref:Pleckstrin (PH) domain-containing protein n=1 Tax=Tieghemostelium lacteum TaxID=361077 RepID=A0A152A761_TIELA|nr:pleckstrin (PH) domain-containing protein [Tieghemostelium lacteum]|eukprot:KYR01975.1 pleckstrin (PH) domain-containing protein [Tieghemostelium lacteum]
MNSTKSVVWGFTLLTVAGMGAWYVSRGQYMDDRKKRLLEIQSKTNTSPTTSTTNNNNNNNNNSNNTPYAPHDLNSTTKIK